MWIGRIVVPGSLRREHLLRQHCYTMKSILSVVYHEICRIRYYLPSVESKDIEWNRRTRVRGTTGINMYQNESA